jgi:hypothetical protein
MGGIRIRLVGGQGVRLAEGRLDDGTTFRIVRRIEGSRFPFRGLGHAIVATRGSVLGRRARIRLAYIRAVLERLQAVVPVAV